MKHRDTTTKRELGKLRITQEDVISVIKRVIALEGLDKTAEEYKHLCYLYATLPGWAEAAEAITALLAAEREKALLQEQAMKLETAKLGAPAITQHLSACQVFTGTVTDATFNPQLLQPYE